MEVFLNGNRGLNSLNQPMNTNVGLQRNERLLPHDAVIDNVDDYQVYLREREKSDKYRLVFSLNPLCTNVLFNTATEIIQNEGSEKPIALSDTAITASDYSHTYTPINTHYNTLTRNEAIRDTEYSHPDLGQFVYHCGTDIFNNHMLRRNGFVQIQKMNNSSKGVCSPNFNTIEDFARDLKGDMVADYAINGIPTSTAEVSAHTYNNENLLSFKEAFTTGLVEKDGWFGFENPHTLYIQHKTPDDGEVYLNKAMNNNKGCEFYEMYPDRSLYSFIPKINRFRNGREEYNWDWCLTYPAASEYVYNGCDLLYNPEEDIHGIKIVDYVEGIANGTRYFYFRTPIKHNLSVGDTIRINLYTNNGEFDVVDTEVEEVGVGNNVNTEYWFSIRCEEIEEYIDEDDNGYIIPGEIRVTKLVSGRECDYYFRVFRKMPNMSAIDYTPKDDEILTTDKITEANKKGAYRSVMGKMGFARSIYGDMIAQLIYNDDISIKHLRDNKGRPLSEIFLTLIKTNRGYNEWYSDKKGDSKVEFSHCFGPVSSGIDMKLNKAEWDGFNAEDINRDILNYNIHTIHNVEPGKVITSNGKQYVSDTNIPKSGKALEENININDEYFLGDIVEWNPKTIMETKLSEIEHRFNTYQREFYCPGINISQYQELIHSDDDAISGYTGFTIETKDMGTNINGTRVNPLINPEGYFYKPHYRIELKEYDNHLETYYDRRIVYYKVEKNGSRYIITSSIPHVLNSGDTLILRYGVKKYFGDVTNIIDNSTFELEILNKELRDYFNEMGDDILTIEHSLEIYYPNAELPMGAQYAGSNGAYIYRPFKEFYNSDSQKLQNAVFTNGAIYLHEDITLYLKRQDPLGIYGLNYKNTEKYTNGLAIFMPDVTMLNIDNEEYVEEKDMEICK